MKIDNLEKINELYFAGVYYLVVKREDNYVSYFKTDIVSHLDDEDYITDVINTGEKIHELIEVLNRIK